MQTKSILDTWQSSKYAPENIIVTKLSKKIISSQGSFIAGVPGTHHKCDNLMLVKTFD